MESMLDNKEITVSRRAACIYSYHTPCSALKVFKNVTRRFLKATAISNLRPQLEYTLDLDTHLDSCKCLVRYASAARFNYLFFIFMLSLLFIADHVL